MFRSLYGTPRSVVATLLLYLGAFCGAVAIAISFANVDLPLANVLTQLPGLPLMAVLLHILARSIARYERATFHENTLREAGTRLVSALDRESIYQATLDAALKLVEGTPEARVDLATGSEEGMTIVASAGYRAAEIKGDRFNLHTLPEPLRDRLLQKQPVEVERPESSDLRKDLGLASRVKPFFVIPLLVGDELRGVIGVTSASALSGEIKEGLVALNSQVSLALESNTLAEEAQKRKSEEHFRSLVQNASDVIMITGADGTLSYISPAVEQILGYKPEDIVGTDSFVPVPPDDAERVQHIFAEVASKPGATRAFELRLQHADGSWRHLESSCTNLLHDPAVSGLVVNSHDVTERKQAEEKLRASEAELRALFEAMDDLIVVFDGEGRCLKIAPTNPSNLYRPPEELLGKTFHETFPKEQADTFLEMVRRTLETRLTNTFEFNLQLDDRLGWFEATFSPMLENAVVAVARDITERKRAEEELRRSERELTEAQRMAHVGSWSFDMTRDEGRWSDEMYRIFGFAPQEFPITYKKFLRLVHPDDKEILRKAVRAALYEDKDRYSLDYRLVRPDGEIRFLHSQYKVVREESRRPVSLLGTSQDVTERQQAEDELRKSEATNRAILQATPDLMFRVSRDGVYLDFRANNDSKLYIPRGEIIGKNVSDSMPPDLVAPMLRNIAKTLDTGEMQVFEYQLLMADEVLDFEARLVVSGPEEVLTIVRNVTERKALERRLEHQAFHDALTGLPNRALFTDRLEHALVRAVGHQESVAVLFLDLDNFKVANDSLGHEVGDHLLVAVAERLQTSLRSQDTLARLGGDEFTILLEDIEGIDDATEVAERVEKALRAPFEIKGQEVCVTASIGIALGGSDPDLPSILLRNADLAMYQAKDTGKARYEMYEPNMNERALERLKLENELRRALEKYEFRVYYQPKLQLVEWDNELQRHLRETNGQAIATPVVLPTPRIVGAEALIRWEHPERGLVLPDQFIPIAEETGLIVPIGRWVLGEACRQARWWQECHPSDPPLTVCVNLSAREFQQPDLTDTVAEILNDTGLKPCSLNIEITESLLMEDTQHTIDTLQALKELGVQLSIDDFGTGYSSLSYLNRFPVDILKIDRTFVAKLGSTYEDTALVSLTVNLSHIFDLKVVAEGVEKDYQLRQLRKLGCDQAQGYYFSKPLPSYEMSAKLGLVGPESNHSGLPN
jgi:diguanylate cyclase (GGDEF)-like protein/PAS domain S-box-containing protein